MKIALIQLNEINFQIVEKYIKRGFKLNFLKKVLENSISTQENEEYSNLEPWIQWVTFFKGQPYKKHGIFRLGDNHKISSRDNLFFELNNYLDLSCAAISPMNTPSGGCNFDYFIPDPWSKEKTIGSLSLRMISGAIKQAVNENTGKGINIFNKIKLIIGIFFNCNLVDISKLLRYIRTIKGKPHRKALLLDYILILINQNLNNKYKTEFSSVFLNAGAHIQHRYFFNSKVIEEIDNNPIWYIEKDMDPLLEALYFYDRTLQTYEELGYKVILLTGLRQIPFSKPKFMYRLKNHKSFLDKLNLRFLDVLPRMTGDFEILFSLNKERDIALNLLKDFTDENLKKVFEEIEIREKSLFCVLTYDKEIKNGQLFKNSQKTFNFYDHVNFVCIKNGIHDKKGTFYISDTLLKDSYGEMINLENAKQIIYKEIKRFSKSKTR